MHQNWVTYFMLKTGTVLNKNNKRNKHYFTGKIQNKIAQM
jgi:hypothetical protein